MLSEMRSDSRTKIGSRSLRRCGTQSLLSWRWVPFAILSAGISSCAAEEEDPVLYSEVAPIIEAKCLRCHGSPRMNGAPVSFTTYEEVYAERRAMEEHLGPIGDMPPVFRTLDPPVLDLTLDERELLLTWLRDGALE
jgi:uncharacterized membrane protein